MQDNLVQLIEIQQALKEWFPPEAHSDRALPGGGKWLYLPWQVIRDRLDQVAPFANISYSMPIYLGDYCSITCTIEILGVSKQGVGNAKIMELSNNGKDMSRGTPIERATADAFKQACENWGCGRYLDLQADPKTKANFIRYMQSRNDGRAAKYHHQNEGNLPDRPTPKTQRNPFGQKPLKVVPDPETPSPPKPNENLSRLRAFAKLLGLEGKPGDALIRAAIAEVTEGKMSDDLSEPEVEKVRDRVAINWAIAQFPENARAAIVQQFVSLNGTDEAIGREWFEWVIKRVQASV